MVIPFIHNHLGKQFFYLFLIFLGKYFDTTLIVNHIDYYLSDCLSTLGIVQPLLHLYNALYFAYLTYP